MNKSNYKKLFKLIESRKAYKYREMAQRLSSSIDHLFFDKDKGAWFDFDLPQGRLRTKFYPSNIYPLLLDVKAKNHCGKVVEYLHESGALGFRGDMKEFQNPNIHRRNSFIAGAQLQ